MADTPEGGRPRPRTMVRLDLQNAYARLGVSPLMPTEEIKEVINRKRKEVMRKRRTRGEQQFGAEEAEMTRLQAIQDEIGSPRARAQYDRLNPQNALLTIQPSPGDVGLDPRFRAALATAWLVEELGRESPLPSPESLALWAPRGLDPDLVAFLARFAGGDGGASDPSEFDAGSLPEVADLGRLGLGDPPADGSSPEHRPGGSTNG
jgi:hypothetical protein